VINIIQFHTPFDDHINFIYQLKFQNVLASTDMMCLCTPPIILREILQSVSNNIIYSVRGNLLNPQSKLHVQDRCLAFLKLHPGLISSILKTLFFRKDRRKVENIHTLS